MMKNLSKEQQELLNLFYSMKATKVLYKKSVRKKFWSLVTTNSNLNSCLSQIKAKVPAMAHQIEKHIDSSKAIQSAVFSECVYAQTLANMLGLNYIENVPEIVKSKINELLKRKNLNLHSRYIYYNEDFSKVLIQAGGCNGIDAVLIISGSVYTIEMKEPAAKTSEPDLPSYGEDGVLSVTEEFKDKNSQFIPMLEEQKGLNFFDVMGSNINNFSEESLIAAVNNNYTKEKSCKYADVILTEDKNADLVMLPSQDISKWADIVGEIRPAGRNHYKVWTPVALKRFIKANNGEIIADVVTIPVEKLSTSRQRGNKNKDSRYKINSLFFVYIDNCTISNNIATFKFSDIQQLKPTIAAKIYFKKITYSQLKEAYYE